MKKVVFEKNYNKKLKCNSFIHIGSAPVSPLTESVLLEPIEISVKSEPGLFVQAVVSDIIRLKLTELRSIHTLLSHNMQPTVFREWWTEKHPTVVDLAVYFFTRLQ